MEITEEIKTISSDKLRTIINKIKKKHHPPGFDYTIPEFDQYIIFSSDSAGTKIQLLDEYRKIMEWCPDECLKYSFGECYRCHVDSLLDWLSSSGSQLCDDEIIDTNVSTKQQIMMIDMRHNLNDRTIIKLYTDLQCRYNIFSSFLERYNGKDIYISTYPRGSQIAISNYVTACIDKYDDTLLSSIITQVCDVVFMNKHHYRMVIKSISMGCKFDIVKDVIKRYNTGVVNYDISQVLWKLSIDICKLEYIKVLVELGIKIPDEIDVKYADIFENTRKTLLNSFILSSSYVNLDIIEYLIKLCDQDVINSGFETAVTIDSDTIDLFYLYAYDLKCSESVMKLIKDNEKIQEIREEITESVCETIKIRGVAMIIADYLLCVNVK